jgi:hypothetical protein
MGLSAPEQQKRAAWLQEKLLLPRLAAAITGGARQLFAPALVPIVQPRSKTIAVPVIVLRDHQRYNPFAPGHTGHINTGLILSVVRVRICTNHV